ncbi:deoxyribodipyrimidine photo-lyase, partial [Sulfitobacter sp. 15WGC]
ATPSDIPAPPNWPQSAALDDWQMDAEMQRGRDVVRPYVRLGGAAAQARLGSFMAHIVEGYDESRDMPGEDGTSALSENLSLG